MEITQSYMVRLYQHKNMLRNIVRIYMNEILGWDNMATHVECHWTTNYGYNV